MAVVGRLMMAVLMMTVLMMTVLMMTVLMMAVLMMASAEVTVVVAEVEESTTAARPDGESNQVRADPRDQQSAHDSQPWIDPIGCGQGRQRDRGSEDQDTDRVGDRHRRAQGQRLTHRPAALTEEIGRHHGLAVTGSERVHRTQEGRGQHQHHPRSERHLTRPDQPIGQAVDPGNG